MHHKVGAPWAGRQPIAVEHADEMADPQVPSAPRRPRKAPACHNQGGNFNARKNIVHDTQALRARARVFGGPDGHVRGLGRGVVLSESFLSCPRPSYVLMHQKTMGAIADYTVLTRLHAGTALDKSSPRWITPTSRRGEERSGEDTEGEKWRGKGGEAVRKQRGDGGWRGRGGRPRQEDGAKCVCNPTVAKLPPPSEGARAVTTAGFDRHVLPRIHQAVAMKRTPEECPHEA